MNLGELDLSQVLHFKFTSRQSTGVPATLGGSPVISVYKSNSTTQTTTGVTLTADFDSITGLNHVAIDTSTDGTFYATATDFDVVITTGTVNSVSVVGEVVGHFSIRNRAGLYPTTASRTLDVSAAGEAGIDWANIGGPTTSQTLSGTTVGTATALGTGAVNTTSVAAGAIDADALAADAANEIADALLDRSNGIETSYTVRQALRLILAATAAKLSGAATTTVTIRDVGDSKDRITATVDSSGNRTAVTLDAT